MLEKVLILVVIRLGFGKDGFAEQIDGEPQASAPEVFDSPQHFRGIGGRDEPPGQAARVGPCEVSASMHFPRPAVGFESPPGFSGGRQTPAARVPGIVRRWALTCAREIPSAGSTSMKRKSCALTHGSRITRSMRNRSHQAPPSSGSRRARANISCPSLRRVRFSNNSEVHWTLFRRQVQ